MQNIIFFPKFMKIMLKVEFRAYKKAGILCMVTETLTRRTELSLKHW